MIILVTGGSGFIGSNLCRKLLKDGHKVYCFDNLYSGYVENIEDLKSNDNFKFFKVDITSDEFFEDTGNIDEVDMIYHLACPASPKYYQRTPINTINTCIKGTINVLDYAVSVNAKVLFTSTSEVYGEPLYHPQKETNRGNVNTLGIRACYDEGKRLAETIMMEYMRLYDLDIKIVRIFNTYGPGMHKDDGRVITNFIKQAFSNIQLTVYGDGTQTRSLCYIDDMIDGLIKMMESEEHGPINLGNPEEHNINYLANLVISLTGSTNGITNLCLPEDDPTRRCPDITKAINLLKWVPTTCLSVGLSNTINSFSNLFSLSM
jgi:UDP-glucuronate decarboxylase